MQKDPNIHFHLSVVEDQLDVVADIEAERLRNIVEAWSVFAAYDSLLTLVEDDYE